MKKLLIIALLIVFVGHIPLLQAESHRWQHLDKMPLKSRQICEQASLDRFANKETIRGCHFLNNNFDEISYMVKKAYAEDKENDLITYQKEYALTHPDFIKQEEIMSLVAKIIPNSWQFIQILEKHVLIGAYQIHTKECQKKELSERLEK